MSHYLHVCCSPTVASLPRQEIDATERGSEREKERKNGEICFSLRRREGRRDEEKSPPPPLTHARARARERERGREREGRGEEEEEERGKKERRGIARERD